MPTNTAGGGGGRRFPLLAALVMLLAATTTSAQHMGGGGGGGGMAMMTPGGGADLDKLQATNLTTGEPMSPCVTSDPSNAECASVRYPHPNAVVDINALCKAMHFMSACSVSKACNASGAGPNVNATGPGALNISRNNPNVCRPFQHIATVCRLDDGMGRMKGCANFNRFCAANSVADMCLQNATGLPGLPTTRASNADVRAICERDPAKPGCAACLPSWRDKNATYGDCDLLSTYAALCRAAPTIDECAGWHRMCRDDETLWLCDGYDAAAAASGAGGNKPLGGGAAAKSGACIVGGGGGIAGVMLPAFGVVAALVAL